MSHCWVRVGMPVEGPTQLDSISAFRLDVQTGRELFQQPGELGVVFAEQLADRLAVMTQGNPLFLLEMARDIDKVSMAASVRNGRRR